MRSWDLEGWVDGMKAVPFLDSAAQSVPLETPFRGRYPALAILLKNNETRISDSVVHEQTVAASQAAER